MLRNKKEKGGVLPLIPLTLMVKHTEKKNQYLKIFLEWIEIFFIKICRSYNYRAYKVIWWNFMVPIFCYKIKCEIKLKNWVKINYAYYIFFDFFWFSLFQCSVDAGKHGGLPQINARLMNTTQSVSNIQGWRKHLVSLTCHIVLYGCSHRNVWIITKYICTVSFLFKLI